MKNIFALLIFMLMSQFAFSQILFTTDFELGLGDWDANGGWKVGDTEDCGPFGVINIDLPEHTNFAYVNGYSNNDDEDGSGNLISPEIDLTAHEDRTVLMSFDIFGSSGSADLGTEFQALFVSEDDGENWEPIYQPELSFSYEWVSIELNLSAYAGKKIVLAYQFVEISGTYAEGFAVDDIKIYIPNGNDVRLISHNLDVDNPENFSIPITLNLENLGGVDINTLDITYEGWDGPITETLENLDFKQGTKMTVIHPIEFNTGIGFTILKMSVSNPNGEDDIKPDNNKAESNINTFPVAEGKSVFVQSSTGTWCGWCPLGHYWMDRFEKKYGDLFVGMEVHIYDVMSMTQNNDEYHDYFAEAADNSAPVILLDKDEPINLNLAHKEFLKKLGEEPDVYISGDDYEVDFYQGTLSATITITANKAGFYHINAYLVEDEVTGESEAYAQNNYYAGGIGSDFIYSNLPPLIPASYMVYQQVARGYTSGTYGESAGEAFEEGESRTITVSSPVVLNEVDGNHVRVAVVALGSDSKKVVNAAWAKTTVNNQDVTFEDSKDLFNIYPNPARSFAKIDFKDENLRDVQVEVFNSIGQLVLNQKLDQVNEDQFINVSEINSGLYTVIITHSNKKYTKQLIVQHD